MPGTEGQAAPTVAINLSSGSLQGSQGYLLSTSICAGPAGAWGFTLQPRSSVCSVLMFASSAWHLGRTGSEFSDSCCCCCQGNGCKQVGSGCLGCHLQLGPLGHGQPQASAVDKPWVFLTRQVFSSSYSQLLYFSRQSCLHQQQMFIYMNERMKIVLHLFLMMVWVHPTSWKKFGLSCLLCLLSLFCPFSPGDTAASQRKTCCGKAAGILIPQ